MKRNIIILLFLISCWVSAQEASLKIHSITEYVDGYLITGIDTIKNDTLFIVSKRENITEIEKYERLKVGEQYIFQIDDRIRQMAAMPPENFVVRIKTTVVWKNGDSNKNIPVFATNLKDLYIEK